MAVVAAFTANKVTGLVPPSETINFIDQSTGSPTNWLWDFGDGTYSYEQNPSHTFTGDVGAQFVVTLKAWIHSSTTSINLRGGIYGRSTSYEDDEATAFSVLQSEPFTGSAGTDIALVNLENGIGGVLYRQLRLYNPAANPAALTSLQAALVLEATRISTISTISVTIDTQFGNVEIKIDGSVKATISGIGAVGTAFPVLNLSPWTGTTFELIHQSRDVAFGQSEVDIWMGHGMSFQYIYYNVSDADNMDTEQRIISFIGPEIVNIDFVGTPLSGTSPLAVQFTDLSVVNHALSVWDFGDGNTATFAGQTHPLNTYTTDSCSIALL